MSTATSIDNGQVAPEIPERAGIHIEELALEGGPTLKLNDNSIVVFVGPNNSGKSLSLKEILYIIENGDARTVIIKSIKLQRVGNVDALNRTMEPYKSKQDGNFYWGDSEYNRFSGREIESVWHQDAPKLGELAKLFVAHLTTQIRLKDSNPAETFNASKFRLGIHPIHSIYLDYEKELQISYLFHKYFGQELVVHRSFGKIIPLYVGERPRLNAGETVVSRSYLDKIESLQPLERQGDGFRSFASIVLRVWTGLHSILLVDEPEAFLHPPQARAVGEIISAGADFQKQVFIATHSNEVIQGLLSKFSDRVSVVRLDRAKYPHTSTYLPNAQISELWRDPILRYSNILNGLFHSQVIVTEADGDCRFYEAVADSLASAIDPAFYTYAGGKDRIAVIVRALKALSVPVKVVVDIDIFASDNTLKEIVEAYGEDWVEIKTQVKAVQNVIQSKKSWLIGAGFKDRVSRIIGEIKDNEIVPRQAINSIQWAMRETSPWEAIKDGGVRSIPAGEPARQIKSLIGALEERNIFVVPVGQMERFNTNYGSHGPRWVAEVLKLDMSNDPDLQEARDFVTRLVGSSASINIDEQHSVAQTRRLMLGKRQLTLQRVNILLRISGNFFRSLFFLLLSVMAGVFITILIMDKFFK